MSRVLGRAGGRAGLYLLEDMVDSLCHTFSSDFFNLSQYIGNLSQLFYAVSTCYNHFIPIAIVVVGKRGAY